MNRDELNQILNHVQENPVTQHGDYKITRKPISDPSQPVKYYLTGPGDKEIGDAVLAFDRNGPRIAYSHIDESYRHRGLGRLLYDTVDKDLAKINRRLVPDSVLSPDAVNMWQGRRPEALEGFIQNMTGPGMHRPAGVKPIYGLLGPALLGAGFHQEQE